MVGSPSIQLENGISLGLGGYILVYGPIVVNVLSLSIVTHHMQNKSKNFRAKSHILFSNVYNKEIKGF